MNNEEATEIAQSESGHTWLGEQSDLLVEEGLTGHPLSGAYICVNKTNGS